VPTVVDLASALWTAAGVDGLPLTPAAEAMRTRIGDTDHLVFVLADGLGMELLEAMPAASVLWSHLAGELRTVFPSTTAVALTTLATAVWPANHGIVGHWMQFPKVGTITVLQFATRSENRSLTDLGVSTDQLFLMRSLLPQVRGRATFSLLPFNIAGSGYSSFVSGGTQRLGFRSLNEAADAVVRFIEQAAGPTYTYLYLPRIDEAAHDRGPASLEVVGVVRELDRVLGLLAAALGGRARIVLSADHGHLASPPVARHVLRGGDDLASALRAPPAGDARVLTFHLQPGTLEAFAAGFRERFRDRFLLLTPDELEALALLGPGPLADETRHRLGDVVAISTGADTLEYRTKGARADMRLALPSHHSGLTSAEMRVPLVVM
jgi:hypothetical protein